jgi:multicomponent Na+:H+ antiporter subunit E
VTAAGRLPGILWLALVWVLLWGTFTPLSVVGGLLIGLLVTAVLRLPLASDRLPLRPVRVLALLGYVARDLVVSAVEVSWQTLRLGSAATGAVLAVPLLSRSDRVVTIMANALSLLPGTMTLQLDHEHGVWYVYALGPRDHSGVERARAGVLDLQRRVLEAFGTPEEVAQVGGRPQRRPR